MAKTAPTTDADQEQGEEQSPGEAALQAAIDEHGEQLAAVLEQSDQVEDAIDTMILMLASAEEEDVEYVADALSNLVRMADAAATEETVALAEFVGENGEDATEVLDKLLELDRQGTLDDLLDLGETFAKVDLDDDSVETMNHLLSALSEAEDDAEPMGLWGALRSMGSRDAKAGIGFLVSLLRATGRRLHRR